MNALNEFESGRPSILARAAPRMRDSVMLVRATLLPPEPDTRHRRMAITAVLFAGFTGAAYVITGLSLMWAFLVVIVFVPIVVLPGVMLVGMVKEARSRRFQG